MSFAASVCFIYFSPHTAFLRDNRYVHERSCARFNEHPVVVLLAGAPAHRTKKKGNKEGAMRKCSLCSAHTKYSGWFFLCPSTELYIPEYDCHNRSYEPVVAVIITCAALLIWLRLPPPPKDADSNGKFLFFFRLLLDFLYCLTTSPVEEPKITADTAKHERRHGNIGGWREHFSSIFHRSGTLTCVTARWLCTLKALDLHDLDTDNFHRPLASLTLSLG